MVCEQGKGDKDSAMVIGSRQWARMREAQTMQCGASGRTCRESVSDEISRGEMWCLSASAECVQCLHEQLYRI